MAADNPRIDELRRRIDKDPASIAFAQLAEEYRRAGDPNEAVRVCLAGLVQHPNYVSARVTLGRALMELGQLDDAQAEFEQALVVAPDNLVAVRSMAELYQLRGDTPPDGGEAPKVISDLPPLPNAALPPLPEFPSAVTAPHLGPVTPPPLPDLALHMESAANADAAVDVDVTLTDVDPPYAAPPADLSMDLDAAVAAFNAAFGVQAAAAPEPESIAAPEPAPAPNPVLEDLEGWLSAIVADREERDSSS